MRSMRTITKIGDLFKTVDTARGHRYIQLIAIDKANMNSDVIAVLTPTPIKDKDSDYDLEMIAHLPVEFYTHTTVKFGVSQGLWKSIGSAPVYVDSRTVKFKYFRDQDIVDSLIDAADLSGNESLRPKNTSSFWDVWSIGDQDFTSISLSEGAKLAAEPGGIYPPDWLMKRIETGKPFVN